MIPADSGVRVDWAMTAVPSGTCSGPMLWDVFGTHVVGRVRGPCCGKWSRLMLWDVLRAYVLGGLRDRWCWMCSGPMLWDVSGAHVVASIHIHSPGPQALSINQVRRPYQYTWSACRVKSPGPQALLIHQVRRPYSLQQFSCTHLGRKSPRRHLEDHLANLAGGRIMVACKNNVPEPR